MIFGPPPPRMRNFLRHYMVIYMSLREDSHNKKLFFSGRTTKTPLNTEQQPTFFHQKN